MRERERTRLRFEDPGSRDEEVLTQPETVDLEP
jgi:hypothetical protein